MNTSRYAANWQLVAATQIFGESQKAGAIITGFLDLTSGLFRNKWWRMEEDLALEQERIMGEVVLQNLKDSIAKQSLREGVVLHNGRVPLTVSFDMGWQKKDVPMTRCLVTLWSFAFLQVR